MNSIQTSDDVPRGRFDAQLALFLIVEVDQEDAGEKEPLYWAIARREEETPFSQLTLPVYPCEHADEGETNSEALIRIGRATLGLQCDKTELEYVGAWNDLLGPSTWDVNFNFKAYRYKGKLKPSDVQEHSILLTQAVTLEYMCVFENSLLAELNKKVMLAMRAMPKGE